MSITAIPRWRRWFSRGALAFAVLGMVVFLAISCQIGWDVHAAAGMAVREYDEDPVSALMAYADSSAHSLRDRNRAVWALGHIGDPRGLTILEKHYTGKPCDHDLMLCQRELENAIRLCRGGLNLPALVWRHAGMSGGVIHCRRAPRARRP